MSRDSNRWQFRLLDVMVFTALFAAGCWFVPADADALFAGILLGIHAAALGIIIAMRRAWWIQHSDPYQEAGFSPALTLATIGAVPSLACWLWILAAAFAQKVPSHELEVFLGGASGCMVISLPLGWIASAVSLLVLPYTRRSAWVLVISLLSLVISTSMIGFTMLVMGLH
jgi:hypothetical protein